MGDLVGALAPIGDIVVAGDDKWKRGGVVTKGKVVSKIRHANGLTKILVKGLGHERNQRAWLCTEYGHLVEPGSFASWREAGTIRVRRPWSDGVVMIRRIAE